MEWTQVYNPLNSLWLSALVAFLPIALFFVSLVIFKTKGHTAGALTVILAAIIAVFFYGMPFDKMLFSFVYGALYGIWPIAWIIVAAIFLYKLTVKSGYFDILRESIIAITPDQRLQVILIGFCFGAFLEGAIGFGGPVAITAALLVGMGLKPLYAAGLCLIANTAPVAFGAVGIPIIAMAGVVGVPAIEISSVAGHMLPPLSLFVPFFLVFLMDGFKGVKETSKALSKRLDADLKNCIRLIHTEHSYFMGEATAKAYEEMNVEKYQFLATLDNRTSEICQKLDGKVFNLKDRVVGVNASPMHVSCRSCEIPYIDNNYLTRFARDSKGKRIEIPSSITYKEWREIYKID